jgi:hypothetical protein
MEVKTSISGHHLLPASPLKRGERFLIPLFAISKQPARRLSPLELRRKIGGVLPQAGSCGERKEGEEMKMMKSINGSWPPAVQN